MTEQLRGIEPVMMPLFGELVGGHDPLLLLSILESQDPTLDERERVLDILGQEHADGIFPDYSGSTQRSKDAMRLIEQFVAEFPLER
jgi:hypothetical protein